MRALALPLRRLPAVALPSARLRWRLAALLAACALVCALYMLWFRDSGLVEVEQVTVTGLTTSDAPRVRAALDEAARSMTTLHVDHERLRRAVGAFPVVSHLRVSPGFPDTLRIEVVEHRPAALALTPQGKVRVAGDGSVLEGLPRIGPLPTIRVRGVGADRVSDPLGLQLARVAGAAPAALRPRLAEVERDGGRGVVVKLRRGPELIFGPATALPAKWAAAVRVLADPASRGASYVDVRLPGRPAAGGLPAEESEPAPPQSAPSAPGPAPPAQPQPAPPPQQQPATPQQPVPQQPVPQQAPGTPPNGPAPGAQNPEGGL